MSIPWWVFALVALAIVVLLILWRRGGDNGPSDGGY